MSRPSESDASADPRARAREGAEVAVASRPAARPQAPVRQAPTDLTLSFVDEATVRAVAAAAADPDWLLADRLAGLRDSRRSRSSRTGSTRRTWTSATPICPTCGRIRPGRVAVRRPARGAAQLPEGAAAYAEFAEDRLTALVLSPEARDAGVVLETLASLGARDPDLLRSLLEGGCTLPENDKLGQMTRALWTHGLFLHVPDGVRVERPIVLRWAMGAPNARTALPYDHLDRRRRGGVHRGGTGRSGID